MCIIGFIHVYGDWNERQPNELRKQIANMLAYDKAFFASEVTERNSLEIERVSADGKVLFTWAMPKIRPDTDSRAGQS